MLSTRPRLWNRKSHALNSVHGQPVKEVCALIRPSHSTYLQEVLHLFNGTALSGETVTQHSTRSIYCMISGLRVSMIGHKQTR